MDWLMCIICGTAVVRVGDPLKCPATRKDGKGLQVYDDFIKRVDSFRELDALPTTLCLPDNTNADELLTNEAKWHQNCKLLFAESKLLRTRERKAKKRNVQESGDATDRRKSKRLTLTEESKCKNIGMCIFCKGNDDTNLHKCTQKDLGLSDMATELQDTDLLATIEGGDLVAINAEYHKDCMNDFKNRHRSMRRAQATLPGANEQQLNESRVFAEMISFIESSVEDDEYMFRLSDLHQMYETRLNELGLKKVVNKTRLKNKLLSYYPDDCQEQTDGKYTLLVFKQGLQTLLKETYASRDFEKDALSAAHVCKVARKELFQSKFPEFAGSFPTDCQTSAVPDYLKMVVSMLLYGPNMKDQSATNSQACLTICQLIRFNSKERSHPTVKQRHRNDKETPLPLYIGLNMHTQTRSRKIVTQLYELGISVSYERVLELEDQLTNAVCKRFNEDGLVCPTQIRDSIYTTGAIDNLDYNPTSQTAEGSFHGTSLSLFQVPTNSNPGTLRHPITVPPPACTTKPSLPDNYRIVPAVACNTDTVSVGVTGCDIQETIGILNEAKEEENEWLDTRLPLLEKDKLEKEDYISWAAHHADRQTNTTEPPGISALLPLFYEKAATISMVKHGMETIKSITQSRNPGQIPVIVGDQPIFALAKYAQWNWPETLGESHYIVMLGGLHTEMALWRMVAGLLDGSGWCTALSEGGVATTGTADSFLKVAHLTKTRHAHQVTAMSLAKLQRDAFNEQQTPGDNMPFDKWKSEMVTRSPTFAFWENIMQMELLVLIFVRSHREQNFALYIEAMEALAPWFFALDHTNYARWLPVHIRDMKALSNEVRGVLKDNWVLRKTTRKFSAMPLDQAHEQNNETVKGLGGAVGLTENPTAFKRWMIAGPEQARILTEFEEVRDARNVPTASHEQGHSSQERFQRQVSNMTETIATMGNPFNDTSAELMTLDTHDCLDGVAVHALHRMDVMGKLQYSTYVTDVLVERKESIHKSIKKNKLSVFKSVNRTSVKSRSKQQFQEIKSDCNLFSQLFVAAQVRDTKLEDFFAHENHPWPPALSQHGRLRLPNNKSELLACLEDGDNSEAPIAVDTKVVDGAAMIHALPRESKSTFGEYSDTIFIPWTERQLENCSRIDIVWDMYRSDSLKAETREKRGKGVRRKVSRSTKLPTNFVGFLQDDRNKEELFAMLSDDVANHKYVATKTVNITAGRDVKSNQDSITIGECDHEEADTRICLHVHDALKQGAKSILVRTVDTDVIVILVGVFHDMIQDVQLSVGFGTGKHFRYININSICQKLGADKSRALPLFHAFTGSDVTSQFSGKGKKTAWKTWKAYPAITDAFAISPFVSMAITSPTFGIVERFTCVLYDNTTQHNNVNDLRQDLFTSKVTMMEKLPPTQSALLQHVNRSIYQASIWLECLKPVVAAPSPGEFGWTRSDTKWYPTWTTLPASTVSCRELVKCGCKANPICSRNCKCKNAGLGCTSLCYCRGDCEAQ